MILFKPLFGAIDLGNYAGGFLQITNRRDSGSALDVDQFSVHGFNDKARSLMLVAARKSTNEFRVSFRDIFLGEWRRILDNELAGSQARRSGDPTLTWQLWPIGISRLSSTDQYLKIHQRLRIEIDWWPDYDASITYHIQMFLDGSGRLRGRVARWAYWVEEGLKSGGIGERLEPKVIAGMETLDSRLASQLNVLSSFRFQDLYYLPGNQVSRAGTGAMVGTTLDDVTIVLERA